MHTYQRSLPLATAAFTVLLSLSGLVHAGGASFSDALSSEDTVRWSRTADSYQGEPLGSAWRADHVAFSSGMLQLRLNTQPCATAPEQCAGRGAASGQLHSNDTYGFGRYTAVLQAAAGDGVVTDFMSYAGTIGGLPGGIVGMHVQGQDPTRMQVSYVQAGLGAQYQTVNLGFNAAQGLHTYAFDWTAGSLRWYVDGGEVFSIAGAAVPNAEGYIVGDVWSASPSTTPLFGTYTGTATRAYFDSIAFEAAVSAVPEPTETLMFCLGGGLLAWRQRRGASAVPAGRAA